MKNFLALSFLSLSFLTSGCDEAPQAKVTTPTVTHYNVERVYRVHYENNPGFYFGFFVKNEETNQLEYHNCRYLSQIIYQDVDEDKPLWAEFVVQEGYSSIIKLHIRKSTRFD